MEKKQEGSIPFRRVEVFESSSPRLHRPAAATRGGTVSLRWIINCHLDDKMGTGPSSD